MTLNEILSAKGRDVYCVAPTANLQNVVEQMVEHNCGSLMVLDDERLVGIISERDVLRVCTNPEADLAMRSVADHMTKQVVTAKPDDDVTDVMGLMSHHRIRHLPVQENGRVVGLISVGDIIKAQFDALNVENHYLWSYLHG